MPDYQLIDHTADFGIKVQAVTLENLYMDTALTMLELAVRPGSKKPVEKKTITAAGQDWPDLMINWLREILYLWNGRQERAGAIKVLRLEPYVIEARADCFAYNPDTDEIRTEIKAVTYHQVSVTQETKRAKNNLWTATVIFDI